MIRTAFVIAFVLGLSACTQAPPPAPDTTAADEKALRDLDAAAMVAWTNKDADKVASFYAEEATIAIPNAPVTKGRQAMRDGLAALFAGDPSFKLEATPAAVEVGKASDIGFVRGNYTVVATDPATKKPVTEKGSYLMAYRKQADGSWKITNDFATPEAPPAAGAAAK